MFKKKQAIIENFYDHAYKILWNEVFHARSTLINAVKICHTKEIKTHLFPDNTDSYSKAIEEYHKAQYDTFTSKLHYITALDKVKEYYNSNHEHFVACKDYYNPEHHPSADTVIEGAISMGF